MCMQRIPRLESCALFIIAKVWRAGFRGRRYTRRKGFVMECHVYQDKSLYPIAMGSCKIILSRWVAYVLLAFQEKCEDLGLRGARVLFLEDRETDLCSWLHRLGSRWHEMGLIIATPLILSTEFATSWATSEWHGQMDGWTDDGCFK